MENIWWKTDWEGVKLTGWDQLTGGTFNKADRGSYACIYGGKINQPTTITTVNIEQSASARRKADICKNAELTSQRRQGRLCRIVQTNHVATCLAVSTFPSVELN